MYVRDVMYWIMNTVLLSGKLYKSVPQFTDLNEKLADLIIHAVSINSGYTSMLKAGENAHLMDQVCF